MTEKSGEDSYNNESKEYEMIYKITGLIKKTPDISNEEIAKELDLDLRVVRNIVKLIDEKKVRILIIGEENDSLRLFLEGNNYLVFEAKNGQEGIKKALEKWPYSPDLIITESLLPDMSGLDIIQRLKEEYDSRSIPIIILSGKDNVNDKIRALDTGADGYITRPFDVREVNARIQAILRRYAN